MTLQLMAELLKIGMLATIVIAALLIIFVWKKNRTTKITYTKLVIQLASVAAIFYIYTYTVRPLLMLSVILVATLFLGRFFCGYICPFGFYMDILTMIRKAIKLRYVNLSDRLNKFLHNFRYVLFAFFIGLGLVFVIMDPPSDFDRLSLMALIFGGPFEHLGILLSPVVPLIVPWTGPLEISGIYFSFPYVQDVIKYSGENLASVAAIIFLVLVAVGSLFIRRVWCRFCPTGISLAVVNKLKGFGWAPILHLDKDEEKCTKCGICKRVCPVQVTEVYEQKGGKIMTSMCMLCLRCVEMCPYEDCLKLNVGSKTVLKSRNWLEPSEVD